MCNAPVARRRSPRETPSPCVPTPVAIKTQRSRYVAGRPSEAKRKGKPKFEDDDVPPPRARGGAQFGRKRRPPIDAHHIAVLVGLVCWWIHRYQTRIAAEQGRWNLERITSRKITDAAARGCAAANVDRGRTKRRSEPFFQHFAASCTIARWKTNERLRYDHMIDTLFAQTLPNAWRRGAATDSSVSRNDPTVVESDDRWGNFKSRRSNNRSAIDRCHASPVGVPGAQFSLVAET